MDTERGGEGYQPKKKDKRAAAEEESGQAGIENAFESAILEGEQRLGRTWLALLTTGAVGGVDVSIGVLALLLVEKATGSTIAGAVGFSIGFIALTLANSELFTENFLVPVAALVAHRTGFLALARLWLGALVSNLLGGWIMMGIIVVALPEIHPTAIHLGDHFFQETIGASSFASALLGGAIITIMTWMQRGTTSVPAKLLASVSAAFLLAAGHLNHAIVASLEMFAALQSGAPFGYLHWLYLLLWFALGNIVGGVGLVTVLRLAQVGVATIKDEQERVQPSSE